MGIGKTIWMILFCFILLFGAGVKGYGQDRKIVIDRYKYKYSAYDDSAHYKKCLCEQDELLQWEQEHGHSFGSQKDDFYIGIGAIFDPQLLFIFLNQNKTKIIGDTIVRACSLILDSKLQDRYGCNDSLYFYVFLHDYAIGWGNMGKNDMIIHIDLFYIENKYFIDSMCKRIKGLQALLEN